jgi:hypothetical protein
MSLEANGGNQLAGWIAENDAAHTREISPLAPA